MNARTRARLDVPLVERADEGWDALPTFIDPGMATALMTLADDPSPLVSALEPFPKTLVHGDFRPANAGTVDDRDGDRAVLIDWGRATAAPASLGSGHVALMDSQGASGLRGHGHRYV